MTVKYYGLVKEGERRVRNGAKWLDENADRNWELNFVSFSSGGHYSIRLHMNYSNECSLAMAFSNQSNLGHEDDGYVHECNVREAYSLTHEKLVPLGFAPDERVDCETLEEMWQTIIEERLQKRSVPRQHSGLNRQPNKAA